jgi:hypothetical protein
MNKAIAGVAHQEGLNNEHIDIGFASKHLSRGYFDLNMTLAKWLCFAQNTFIAEQACFDMEVKKNIFPRSNALKTLLKVGLLRKKLLLARWCSRGKWRAIRAQPIIQEAG